jgi:phage gp36-like protein
MAYTTIEEVRLNHERIPEGSEEDAIIAKHIDWVNAVIDARLRGKYEVPFATTPALIGMIACDLVTFRTLRSLFGAQVETYQQWLDQYKTPADTLLDDIVECRINLDPELVTARERLKSNTQGKEAIFDLGDPYDQAYHPTAADQRYGEDT